MSLRESLDNLRSFYRSVLHCWEAAVPCLGVVGADSCVYL